MSDYRDYYRNLKSKVPKKVLREDGPLLLLLLVGYGLNTWLWDSPIGQHAFFVFAWLAVVMYGVFAAWNDILLDDRQELHNELLRLLNKQADTHARFYQDLLALGATRTTSQKSTNLKVN